MLMKPYDLSSFTLIAADPNFVPDPKPLLDFDLKTARTRDYIYVNKVLR